MAIKSVNILAATAILLLGSTALSFETDQKISCISEDGEMSVELTIESIEESLASAIVTEKNRPRIYGKNQVDLKMQDDGASFVMLNTKGQIVENLLVSYEVSDDSVGAATYNSRASYGQSNSIDMYCISTK